MDRKICRKLEEGVREEDFSTTYQPVVSCIGIKASLELCRLSGGVHQYIPLYANVLEGSRNRAIVKEFDGTNSRALAWKYEVTEAYVRELLAKQRREKNKKILIENQQELF